MTVDYSITYAVSLGGYYPLLHGLLDRCYPKPPRDVFYRLVGQYRPGFPAWLARDTTGGLIGFVHLAPNSKGGTLETLAVDPGYRGRGIAQALVRSLVTATPGLITLTTRIPDFFQRQGFETICTLPDASVFMRHLCFTLPTPSTVTPIRGDTDP